MPSSPAGLHNSTKNSNKHGFTAQTLVLRPEEEEPFREFQEKHLAKYQPVGVDEEYCAHQIIHNRWRLIQISATETAIYELGYLTHAEKLTATYLPDKVSAMTRALTVTGKQKELGLLKRYQSRLTKQAALDFKQLHDLQKVIKERTKRVPTSLRPSYAIPTRQRAFRSRRFWLRLVKGRNQVLFQLRLPPPPCLGRRRRPRKIEYVDLAKKN